MWCKRQQQQRQHHHHQQQHDTNMNNNLKQTLKPLEHKQAYIHANAHLRYSNDKQLSESTNNSNAAFFFYVIINVDSIVGCLI